MSANERDIFYPLSLWKSITFLIRVRVQQLRKPVSITCFVIWSNNKVLRPDFKLQLYIYSACLNSCTRSVRSHVAFSNIYQETQYKHTPLFLQGNFRLLPNQWRKLNLSKKKIEREIIKFGWSLHYRWQTRVEKFVICLLKSDIVIVSRITSSLSSNLHGLCFPPTRLSTGAPSSFYTVNLKPAFPCKPINLSNNLPHRSLIPMQGHRDLEIVNEFIIAQQTGCLNSLVLASPQMTPPIYLVFINLPKLAEKELIKSDWSICDLCVWMFRVFSYCKSIDPGKLYVQSSKEFWQSIFLFTKPDDSL